MTIEINKTEKNFLMDMIDDYEAAMEMKQEEFENMVETWYKRKEVNETTWKIIQCNKMREKIQKAEE